MDQIVVVSSSNSKSSSRRETNFVLGMLLLLAVRWFAVEVKLLLDFCRLLACVACLLAFASSWPPPHRHFLKTLKQKVQSFLSTNLFGVAVTKFIKAPLAVKLQLHGYHNILYIVLPLFRCINSSQSLSIMTSLSRIYSARHQLLETFFVGERSMWMFMCARAYLYVLDFSCVFCLVTSLSQRIPHIVDPWERKPMRDR